MMKPGEMTARELLNAFGKEVNLGCDVCAQPFYDEILSRLNAGGSPKVCECGDGGCIDCWPANFTKVALIEHISKLHKQIRGASRPLQARCPECQSERLSLAFSFGGVRVTCEKAHATNILTPQDMLKFFSAPPAMPQISTRFDEFDDAEHPANKWWQKHGQFMMSGGGRRQFI